MDTNKMRDVSREQFEAEFRRQFPITFAAAKAGESKAHGDMSVAWWGWQASREAVVVELPPKWNDAANSNKQAWDCGIEDARMAIEAKGLKVRP